jgi:hypothetical protein
MIDGDGEQRERERERKRESARVNHKYFKYPTWVK